MIKLYSYYRSSAAYRIRIALNYKQLEYKINSVDLIQGAQKEHNYLAHNMVRQSTNFS